MSPDTGVYIIRNVANGKVYVGSSSLSLKNRLDRHKSYLKRGVHFNRHLQAAWNRYGSQAFSYAVLERCAPEECLGREQHWINWYGAVDPKKGYNKSPTAGNNRGCKHNSPAQIRRRSEATRRRFDDPEERRLHGERMRRCQADPEVKRRKGEATKRRYADPEARRQHGEIMKRVLQNPELRRQRSEIIKAKWADPEYRRRLSEIQKAVQGSPEARQLARDRMASPERRRRQSEVGRKVMADPEQKKKMAEGRQRAALRRSQGRPH